jgi:hypothetical protein
MRSAYVHWSKKARGACTHERGTVRHGPNHGHIATTPRFQILGTEAGRDGYDQRMLDAQDRLQSDQHFTCILRFDGEDDDVRTSDRGCIIGVRVHPKVARERFAMSIESFADTDRSRIGSPFEEAADERAAHVAATDKCNF